jgi:hypothetical protein
MTTYSGLRLAMTAAGELPVGERWRAIGACLRLCDQRNYGQGLDQAPHPEERTER